MLTEPYFRGTGIDVEMTADTHGIQAITGINVAVSGGFGGSR